VDIEADLEARRARRRRAGWKRPRRILGLWARLGLLLAVIVALVFFAAALVAKAARPYREAGVQTRQLAELRRQGDQVAAENAALERHIAYLETPEGEASEARSYGYLRPGERPLVVKGLTAPPAGDAPPPAAAPAPSQGGAVRRFWRHLTGR
jgi:cell division protein FtsB